jgi:hypothetical protein
VPGFERAMVFVVGVMLLLIMMQVLQVLLAMMMKVL